MEYYSAMKKNEILPLWITWMDHEDIMLSEMSVRKRQILYNFTYKWNSKKTKLIETERRLVITRDSSIGEKGKNVQL